MAPGVDRPQPRSSGPCQVPSGPRDQPPSGAVAGALRQPPFTRSAVASHERTPDVASGASTQQAPTATAIVSAGNNDHPLTLPAVDRFIGFPPVQGIEGDPAGSITVPLSRIYASTNQLGFNNLSCRSG